MTFGGKGMARKDPDFMAAYIVNHILGGGSFSSRLYQRGAREARAGLWRLGQPGLVQSAAVVIGGTATRADRTADTLAIIEQETRRMAEEGPTAEELAAAKSYLKGAYALSLDTSSKIAAQLTQIQIDNLGIDYIHRRGGLIDAVTLEDAKRVAKRLFGGGMLVTVAGRPKGLESSNSREKPFGAPWRHYCATRIRAHGIVQSIDSALEKTVGQHGVTEDALPAALARAEGALDRLRRHMPKARCRCSAAGEAGRPRTIRDAAVGWPIGATDIVVLGTGGSWLGGQTLAQLACYAVPGVGALRAPPRLHFIDNLDPRSFDTLLGKLPLSTTRFVAISKSGGTGRDPDADHRGAVGA